MHAEVGGREPEDVDVALDERALLEHLHGELDVEILGVARLRHRREPAVCELPRALQDVLVHCVENELLLRVDQHVCRVFNEAPVHMEVDVVRIWVPFFLIREVVRVRRVVVGRFELQVRDGVLRAQVDADFVLA